VRARRRPGERLVAVASHTDHVRNISLLGGVQQMKRRIAVVALVFVAFALIAQQAFADSPHFIRASGSLNNDGSLTVDFKEAGLGTNQNINYELTANASATYVCVIYEG
jgi:hypothetical protein